MGIPRRKLAVCFLHQDMMLVGTPSVFALETGHGKYLVYSSTYVCSRQHRVRRIALVWTCQIPRTSSGYHVVKACPALSNHQVIPVVLDVDVRAFRCHAAGSVPEGLPLQGFLCD